MASAKQGKGLARATCSRNDGMASDCPDGTCALRKRSGTDGSRGKRGLNDDENWRSVERKRWKEVRGQAKQLIRLEFVKARDRVAVTI